MISIKAEVKAEVLGAEEDGEREITTGEGGVLVHGRLVLNTKNRADLFQPDLEPRLVHITCSLCPALPPFPTFPSWRLHSSSLHPTAPGFQPSLLPLEPQADSGAHGCGECGHTFTTREQLEEHRENVVRTVRLVCPQCRGQFGDLEAHLLAEHGQECPCSLCGETVRAGRLAAHHQARHRGFPSVLAESVASCGGDGEHLHWQETVLATSLRFQADEVKPAAAVGESVVKPPTVVELVVKPATTVKPTTVVVKPVLPPPPPLRAKPGVQPAFRPMEIVDKPVGARFAGVAWRREGGHSQLGTDRVHGVSAVSGRAVLVDAVSQVVTVDTMSQAERQTYNIQVFRKFQQSGLTATRTNECEICGFVPYTKNKYREKQDHLAKFHFKERIDAVMPKARPYACPAQDCGYMGKDKQDVLRHYTGKHNILKRWVDDFIREQSGAAQAVPKVAGPARAEVLTFREMEHMAIVTAKAPDMTIVTAKAPDMTIVTAKAPDMAIVTAKAPSPGPEVALLTQQGQKTAFTISKVPRLDSPASSGLAPLSAPSSISLIRLSRPPPPGAPPSRDTTLSPPLSRTRPVPVHCRFCSRDFPTVPLWKDHCLQDHLGLELEEDKPSCPSCRMAFPSPQALGLHREVCQERGEAAGGEVEEISIKEETICLEEEQPEPAKKKARRPPPALIPI